MKQCGKGKHDKLLDPMYSCHSCSHMFTNKFNMHQHIASTLLCRMNIDDINTPKNKILEAEKVEQSSKSETNATSATKVK